MTKHFECGEPKTPNKMASILHSELYVRFRSKGQLNAFIKEFVEFQQYPSFEVSTESEGPITYIVTISEITWAYNLRLIAELLEKYDYNEGE